jgi:RloB-like protein
MRPGTEQWNRGQKQRRVRTLRRLLILCEDTKSSRDYLEQFPFDPAQVEIECVGTGQNTDTLMEEAIRRKRAADDAKAPYEGIWVVFDKDDFPLGNFNRAFDLAKSQSTIRACWSNECVELWYLLHFTLRTTSIGRKEIWRELKPTSATRTPRRMRGFSPN